MDRPPDTERELEEKYFNMQFLLLKDIFFYKQTDLIVYFELGLSRELIG